jgi:hypothetical protein
MSARAFEAFLTRIYVDAAARARFKASPRAEARLAGLSDEECTALENTDWVGLEMAASSFARKREQKLRRHLVFSIWARLRHFFTLLPNRLRQRN